MPHSKIRSRLSLACCSLLGFGPLSGAAEPRWQIELGVMNYNEYERNNGLELLLNAKTDIDDSQSLSLKFEIDTLTGATPNGASSTNVPQTYTMASGHGTYQVAANELPADDTHMDTRMSLAGQYGRQHSRNLSASYDGRISMEFDFLAFSTTSTFNYEFDDRNTTLQAGINIEYDRVHPVGNVPIPFASMAPAGALQPRGVSSVQRRAAELSFGLTRILDKRSLIQFKYTFSRFSGYLNDPYKIVSVIQGVSSADAGLTVDNIFENRPRVRRMHSLYTAYKADLGKGVLDLSYRYLWDDWEILSNTLQLSYKHRMKENFYLRPSVRLYHQNQAEFYRHSVIEGEIPSDFLSADSRLAEFDAYTVGLRYGKSGQDSADHSVALEYYTQLGESHPDDAVGLQKSQDLFPTLHALIIKYYYSFDW